MKLTLFQELSLRNGHHRSSWVPAKGTDRREETVPAGREGERGENGDRWASRGPVQGRLEEVGVLEGTQSEGLLAPGEESVA